MGSSFFFSFFFSFSRPRQGQSRTFLHLRSSILLPPQPACHSFGVELIYFLYLPTSPVYNVSGFTISLSSLFNAAFQSLAMISQKTIVIASAAIGGTATVILFVLLTIWLYRTRHVEKRDEEAPPIKSIPRTFDRRSIILPPPKAARVAPLSFRTAIDADPAYGGSPYLTKEDGAQPDLSPPLLSSVWRGKKWVTITRPKTEQARPPNPISEKPVISKPMRMTRVERLSVMISKLKTDFMEVQL